MMWMSANRGLELLQRQVARLRSVTRRAVLLVALSLALVASVPTADAATTVTGDRDTNAPLEIVPSDDPFVADIDLAGWREVAFIQRMPLTKTIEQVTIGDLARADSCTGDAQAQLVVREHPTGDLTAGDGSQPYTQVAVSPDHQTIDTTLGSRTWTIPPTTFRKGRGYSFLLTWHTGFCRYVKQRTWAHNEPKVNTGTGTCAAEPLLGDTGAAPNRWRMWHQQGANDRHPACVNNTSSEESFHSSMPGGWLATVSYCCGSRAVAGHTHYPGPHEQCGDDQRFGQTGASELFWRDKPNFSPPTGQYVCAFDQYGPPGEQLPHGWYYGLPWRKERNGAPRDVYLKLETMDYDALLSRHEPILKYDSGETFHVLSPGALTDFYVESGIHDWSNTVKDAAGEFGIANPAFAGGRPGISTC